MKKIGLISDTHSYMDDRILHHLADCDEIWHAGDVGDLEVLEKLESIAPIKVAYGNIDGQEVRARHPLVQDFELEGVHIFMIHIGGNSRRFPKGLKEELRLRKPDVFICGHSHILKVNFNKEMNFLYLNPGAAGKHGFHKVRTLLRFELEEAQVKNLRVIELGSR